MVTKTREERIIDRQQKANSKLELWRPTWQLCIDFTDPEHEHITSVRSAGDVSANGRLIDIGIAALNEYAAGIYSYLCQGNWIKYVEEDDKLMKDSAFQEFYTNATKTSLKLVTNSNFHSVVNEWLKSCGSVGTGIIYCEADEDTVVNYRHFPVHHFAFEENNKGRIDVVFRCFKFTARQAVQEFGEKALSEKIRNAYNEDSTEEFEFIHYVGPRKKRDRRKKNSKNKAFESLYLEVEEKKIVKESGYDSMPYVVTRADRSHNEIPGRSPAMNCLGTLGYLNSMDVSIQKVSERKAEPGWVIDKRSKTDLVTNKKGGVTHYDSRRGAKPPMRQDENVDIQVTWQERERKEGQVERAFFLDLFDALKDYRNMTATEAEARISNSLARIAPIIGRYISEGLRPLMERTFEIILKSGKLGKAPKGAGSFSAMFTGRLSQIVEELELRAISQAIGFGLQYVEVSQDILDNYNFDEIAQIGGRNNNCPAKVVRTPEDVTKIRDARNKKLEAQQQLDNMTQVGDAASKIPTKAAESGSMSDIIMGGMNG